MSSVSRFPNSFFFLHLRSVGFIQASFNIELFYFSNIQAMMMKYEYEMRMYDVRSLFCHHNRHLPFLFLLFFLNSIQMNLNYNLVSFVRFVFGGGEVLIIFCGFHFSILKSRQFGKSLHNKFIIQLIDLEWLLWTVHFV